MMIAQRFEVLPDMRWWVVTANRAEELIAEILRVDRSRDVALLKLKEIPEGLKIVTLPLRTEWPGVSESIYVIGHTKNVTATGHNHAWHCQCSPEKFQFCRHKAEFYPG